MNDEDTIVSGFERDSLREFSLRVDFSKAQKLDREGSTCDTFISTIQRRRVFVKRLKAEYRSNPLYRAAFDKEYDLGINLSHPSLAHYVGFGDDYIVMDFIEGDTLSDLIRRGDARLGNRKFVKQMMSELLDVIEYLHRRNVIHCDIKADNVMVSPYVNRPIMLIDLDKAYTSWLDSTHGDSKKYGCDDCYDGTVDLRGFGRIASALGLKRVAEVCEKDTVTAELVRKELNGGRVLRKLLYALFLTLLIIAGICCAFFFNNKKVRVTAVHTPPHIERNDTSDTNNIVTEVPETKVDVTKPEDNSNTEHEPPAPPQTVVKTEPTIAEASAVKESKSSYTNPAVDNIVKKYYGPLYPRLEYLQTLADDPKTSSDQLSFVIKSYAKDQMDAQNAIFKAIYERYGLKDPFEVLPMLGTSNEWGRFMTLDSKINSLYSREIDRRRKKDI